MDRKTEELRMTLDSLQMSKDKRNNKREGQSKENSSSCKSKTMDS